MQERPCKGAVFMTTVCTCGFIFEIMISPHPPAHFLDGALVINAVPCIRVLDKQRAELAKALSAVAITFLVMRAWLLWTQDISQGLQFFWGQHLCAG